MPESGVMCQTCLGTGLVHPASNVDQTCADCLGKGVLGVGSVPAPAAPEQPVEAEAPLSPGTDAGSEADAAASAPEPDEE